jgi:hypothetical protein
MKASHCKELYQFDEKARENCKENYCDVCCEKMVD